MILASSYVGLRRAGRRAFAGFDLVVLARTPSTQDRVRTAARAGAAAGFCCVAAEQTAGRGRQGRRWAAPAGTALLVSILVEAGAHPTAIPLATGLAICDALTTFGVEASLKWPNDVLVDDRKLAGILVEIEPRAATAGVAIGVGLNLSVSEFPAGVAGVSLNELIDPTPDWIAVLTALLPALKSRLDAVDGAGITAIRDNWRARALGLGQAITASSPQDDIRGTAVDIDDDGALLIDCAEGRVKLLAGDVHIGT